MKCTMQRIEKDKEESEEQTDMDQHITAPISKEEAQSLKAGDYVYITGTIYTARDAAHKRMDETLSRGEMLPVNIENQMIYYMGPSPAREGRQIGSDARSDRQDRQRPVEWINMHQDCLIWGLAQ